MARAGVRLVRAAAGTLFAVAALATLAPEARAGDPAALNEAATLYHQARFEDARLRLESMLAEGDWRRRDSLVILQYLGMASSRLGRGEEATGRFGSLLALDSLFRFPRNEDPSVLKDFQAARDARAGHAAVTLATPPAQATPPTLPSAVEPAPGGLTAAPETPGPSLAASARSAIPSPGDPLRADPAPPRPAMNLGLGAVPLGGGWMVRDRLGQGLVLGVLQAGGVLVSVYASERQNRAEGDRRGTEAGEMGSVRGWQWVQRISLSTALGAYLYSIFASKGK